MIVSFPCNTILGGLGLCEKETNLTSISGQISTPVSTYQCSLINLIMAAALTAEGFEQIFFMVSNKKYKSNPEKMDSY